MLELIYLFGLVIIMFNKPFRKPMDCYNYFEFFHIFIDYLGSAETLADGSPLLLFDGVVVVADARSAVDDVVFAFG